jgi:UDP-N-acetylmuramoyl-L-alanyl-D-glutamate--2,6-diaminopimelate ligase
MLMIAALFPSATVAELAHAASGAVVSGEGATRVTELVADSRHAVPGSLFFAVKGVQRDGGGYVADAIARGAVAIVAEPDVAVPAGVPCVRVADCRKAKALMAARFFGEPARKLMAVGVTGTNGKTTTTWMMRAVAEYAGDRTLLLGTIANELAGASTPAANTTPDPIDLHRMLASAVASGARLAVMEVSSHALEQDRVLGVGFRAAAFTNLSPEHLDFHKTLEAYRDAKARLFEALDQSATAVLNQDDPAAAYYASRTKARVVRYGMTPGADVSVEVHRVDIDGCSFALRTPQGRMDVATRMVGRHNLFNAMAAAATCLALEYPLDAVRGGFELLKGVPGRLESVDCGQDFRVLVDFAHTEAALAHVLETLRPLTRGRLITVFGCGGDRDVTKRPKMGAVVSRLSDIAFVTSDNPRTEDPLAIIEQIKAGLIPGRQTVIEPDRKRAIEAALREARGGDIVVLAGKGHEKVQIVGDRRIPFDDVETAREVLWSL